MTSAFDNRLVKVGLQIGNDFLVFEDLDIRIHGQKFASEIMNQCTVKISNLTRDHRNFILTTATPMKVEKTPIAMTVDVGRESYGTFRLFEGVAFVSSVTPPPDIGIILTGLTNCFQIGLVVANSQNPQAPLSVIAKSIADANGLVLKFKAKERNIANFQHTGGAARQIDNLAMIGDVRVSIDNNTMTVFDKDAYADDEVFDLNINTGMIGIPQATQTGAMAQMLVSPAIKLGGKLNLKSQINPAVNNDGYRIDAIDFDICNRDNPFLYTLTLTNPAYRCGVT